MQLAAVANEARKTRDELTISQAPWLRHAARWVALIVCGAMAVLAWLPADVAGPYAAFCYAVGACILVLCAALMLWERRLSIDLRAGAYCLRSGFKPLQSVRTGALADLRSLRFTVQPRFGMPDGSRSLVLVRQHQTIPVPLSRAWSSEAGSAELADRLGVPLEIVQPLPSAAVPTLSTSQPAVRAALTASLWLAMGGAATLMLWPAAHSNPFNHPRKSDSQFAVDSLFGQGWSFYYNGHYANSEKAFKDLVTSQPT